MGTVLAFILVFGLVVGVIYLYVNNLKKWNKQQAAKKDGMQRFSAIYSGLLKHIEGLPLASGAVIEFFYGDKNIIFRKDNQEISLELDKIVSIDHMLGENIKSQAATGAIAGKFLLGGISGAVIGAMLLTTFYLVITYNKDGQNKTILLDTTGSDIPLKKILDDFNSKNKNEMQKIDL